MNRKIRIISKLLLLSSFLGVVDASAGKVVEVQLTGMATQPYECTVEGRVVKVTDGDTVEVLDSKKTRHKKATNPFTRRWNRQRIICWARLSEVLAPHLAAKPVA